jgi:hypothetical protein
MANSEYPLIPLETKNSCELCAYFRKHCASYIRRLINYCCLKKEAVHCEHHRTHTHTHTHTHTNTLCGEAGFAFTRIRLLQVVTTVLKRVKSTSYRQSTSTATAENKNCNTHPYSSVNKKARKPLLPVFQHSR